MKNILTILLFITTIICSCGQSNKPLPSDGGNTVKITDLLKIDESKITTTNFSLDTYIHTEGEYTDVAGKGIMIQNGFPRGGGLIHTSEEMEYGHAVFWSRVVNKTEKPIELNIYFPADSIIIYPSPHVHFKLLVPPDTMTLDQVSVYSYGLKDIPTFVESNFHQPSQLQRTVLPNEASIFYVILLSHLSTSDKGISRTGLFLKDQDFYYRLTSPLGVKTIPCGRIVFKD